jgi:hypothetical protein
MELSMLFYTLLLFKMGLDDAYTFHVKALDCWGLLILSLFQVHRVELVSFIVIALMLCILVNLRLFGNGDRDCLIIMLLNQSFSSWTTMILISSILALIYAFFKQKRTLPFIFFLSVGHFLNFCLKTL